MPGPQITGIVSCSARASCLAIEVLGAVRPPLRRELARERRGAVDLRAQRRRRPGHRGDLERDDERVADRGPRLEAAGQRDHRHLVAAGARGAARRRSR